MIALTNYIDVYHLFDIIILQGLTVIYLSFAQMQSYILSQNTTVQTLFLTGIKGRLHELSNDGACLCLWDESHN